MNREGAKFAKESAKISFFHLPGVSAGEKTNCFLAYLASWRFRSVFAAFMGGLSYDRFVAEDSKKHGPERPDYRNTNTDRRACRGEGCEALFRLSDLVPIRGAFAGASLLVNRDSLEPGNRA
jgi:hypothetical protein